MNEAKSQYFDFSQDAQLFKERLAQRLKQETARCRPIEDDDLEYVNAAGMPTPPREEKERL